MVDKTGQRGTGERRIVYTSKFLRGWWNRAIRGRVLYRALTREDRGYLWLVMRFYEKVKSIQVGRIIVKILAKLNEALKNPLTLTIESYGYGQAYRLSRTATEWGNTYAEEWSTDIGFIKHLANNQLNTPWGIL